MKLLKLEIHNIASIEHAEIDFANGPLNTESQFLISGPTGSGKTTILDAICLALYNASPRMENAGREDFFQGDNEKNLIMKDNDTRVLMRNGSGEAWSKVIFADKDDKILEAKWYCSRAYKRATGNLQSVVHTLSTPDGTVISDKLKKTQALIEQRVGLRFEQFCRTSMLAQGEFTKFLKATRDKKSEILEKLTGISIYTEISQRIFEIESEKKNEVRLLEEKTKGIERLSEEEIAEIESATSSVEKKIEQYVAEQVELEKILQWFAEKRQLEDSERKLQERESHHAEDLASERYIKAREFVEDFNATEEVRNYYSQQCVLNDRLKSNAEEEAHLKQEYVDLHRQLSGLINRRDSSVAELRELEKFISDKKMMSEVYEKISQIKEILSDIRKNEQEIEKLSEDTKNINASSESINKVLEQDIQSVERETEIEKAKREEISAQENVLSQYDYQKLSQNNLSLQNSLSQLRNMKIIHAGYEQSYKNLISKRKDFEQLQQKCRENEVHMGECNKNVDRCKSIKEDAQIKYDKIKDGTEQCLKEIRARLSEGDNCPLCGQVIKEIVTDEQFIKIIAPLREDLVSAEKMLEEAVNKANASEVVYNADNLSLKRLGKEIEQLKEQCDTSFGRLEKFESWQLYAKSDDPQSQIDIDITRKEVELKEVVESISERNKAHEAVQRLHREKDEVEQKIKKITEKISENTQRITKNELTVKNNSDAAKRCELVIASKAASVSEIFKSDKWKQDRGNNSDLFVANLEKEAAIYADKRAGLQKLESGIKLLCNDISEIKRQEEDILTKHSDWQSLTSQAAECKSDLKEMWSKLYANTETLDRMKRDTIEQLDNVKMKVADYLSKNNRFTIERIDELVVRKGEISDLRSVVQKIDNEAVGIKTEKGLIDSKRKEILGKRPKMEDSLTQQSVEMRLSELKDLQSEAHTRIGINRNKLEQDKNNKAQYDDVLKQIEEARRVANDWGVLSNIFGSKDGKKFRNIAQSFIFTNILRNANYYLRQFTTRYEMYNTPATLTIQIRDMEAGGVERPISNISGGESFLLSLSLALGLSSLSNSGMSMDTLFIDEGFGTLDREYLNTVVTALEKLHQMGGKRVGIISHVEGLKERITTQIQVVPADPTRSNVKVVSLL